MCGIAGAFGRAIPDQSRIAATLDALARRGPDDRGAFSGTLTGQSITLLGTRLAIIDLDPRAGQPFHAEGCILVFNGEIYNHVELRKELETLGHRFATKSDTEVVIHGYRAWGTNCVDHFEGMWAFALLDERQGQLVLSRDRFGEKPLYYMQAGGTLAFASEVKALACLTGRSLAINTNQVRRYLVNGYRSLYKKPETYFTDVRELPPATIAVVTNPQVVRPQFYWRLAYRPTPMSLEDAIAGTRERLFRAIELRLRSDVPIAFLLSGGIDSGALATIAAKRFGHQVTAFSIVDRDPRYDESRNITATTASINCAHHVTHTNHYGFFDRLERLVNYHDAPVATTTYYVHSFLCEAINALGFKVAVSGLGADELFTGYYDHYAYWLAEMSDRPDFDNLVAEWQSTYGAHVRNPLLKDPRALAQNPDQRGHIFLDREIFNGLMNEPLEEIFAETTYEDNLLRNRMLNEISHEGVPVLLHEEDRNCMAWSIENRSPFLDRALAEFSFSVPNEHLVHHGRPKWLLRAAVEGLLPDSVRLDSEKRGFNASISSLVDPTDSDSRERLLSSSPIFDIVDRQAMERFLSVDMTPNSYSKFMFSYVSAKLFLESDLAQGRPYRPLSDLAAMDKTGSPLPLVSRSLA